MTQKKPAKKGAKKPAATSKSSKIFSDEEKAAMRERAREQKAAGKEDGEKAVIAKIAAMTEPDRSMGKRIHAIVRAAAPELEPRLWYGMPAYSKDGDVVCFFQDAKKFKARYATLGFSDKAKLDDGQMWPTSFALRELTGADEARISTLVKKAVS